MKNARRDPRFSECRKDQNKSSRMNTIIATTLTNIQNHQPCKRSWKKLLIGLGKKRVDDKPLPYWQIVKICGLDDALWATRAEPQYEREWRLYAVACARRVANLCTDPRVAEALTVAERYAHGQATGQELDAARNAVDDAVLYTTRAVRDAALRAISTAALYAASATALNAGSAAALYAARAAALATAYKSEAVEAAEHEWQKQAFLEIVGVPA
jgi:hypothetical protein